MRDVLGGSDADALCGLGQRFGEGMMGDYPLLAEVFAHSGAMLVRATAPPQLDVLWAASPADEQVGPNSLSFQS